MFGGMKDIRWGKGVHQKVFQEHNQNVKQKYEIFKSLAPRLTDAVGKMREQKEKWSAEPDPKKRENLLREYDVYVLAAIQVMDQQVQALRDAAKDGYVVTSEGVVATADAKKLWEKLQVDTMARTNAVAGLGEDGRPVE
jgi:Tfp pilus assembly protein PilP